MEEANFFSADSHVNEPPEAWERIPKGLCRGPDFVQDPPGLKGLYMVFDGHDPDPVGMTFTAGVEKEHGGIRRVIKISGWEDWRGPWDPVARRSDMERDGVAANNLSEPGAKLLHSRATRCAPKAGLKAYNDWIVEYCGTAPKKLISLGLLSALDIEWSLEEMKRCVRLGAKGVLLPSALPDGQS